MINSMPKFLNLSKTVKRESFPILSLSHTLQRRRCCFVVEHFHNLSIFLYLHSLLSRTKKPISNAGGNGFIPRARVCVCVCVRVQCGRKRIYSMCVCVCVCVWSYQILHSLNTNSIECEPQKLNLDILLFTD